MGRRIALAVLAAATVAGALWALDVSPAALLPRTVTGWLVVACIAAVLVLWSRVVVPRLTRRPRVRTGLRTVPLLALVAVVVVPAAVDREVSESLLEGVPTASAGSGTEPTPSSAGTSSPAGPGAAPTSVTEPSAPATSAAPAEPVLLSSGALRGVGHVAEGTANLYRSGGTHFVRLELDDVQGAVDVFVWLVPDADQTTPDGGVDLGALKGTRGEANYVVPADVDVSGYRTVLLWCRAFATPIAVSVQA
jgi:Electron transfer DM13